MLYSFDDAKAADRHETQYFEMFCNRGIYHKGWTWRGSNKPPILGWRLRNYVRFELELWSLIVTDVESGKD
jgi:arylsulfatase